MLSREIVLDAFDAMGIEAARRGLVMEIAVYGGSCLMLASDIRDATGDVDAVFLTDATVLYEIGDLVGRRLALPSDWLNQAVRRVAPPPGGAEPALIAFGDYPRQAGHPVGLRVFLPSPEYLLAMKLLANRGDDDLSKAQTDLADIHALMRVTGIDDVEAMTQLVRRCYPRLPGVAGSALAPRLTAKIASVLDGYAPDPTADHPTWHAGRGPATRAP